MDETYGALYIGLLFAVFFQGVLTLQAYIYYESFPKDPLRIKLVVAAVWVVDLVHLVLISSAGYYYFITNWGNAPALLRSTVTLDVHLVMIGIATLICQAFFLHRVWVLSGHQTILVSILAIGCLTTFALDLGMSVFLSRKPWVSSFSQYTPETIALFSTGAGIDLIIAGFLCYYLVKGRSGTIGSNSLIDHIVQYTVATGLATSLLALGCLIAYLIRPNSFIYIAMHFSLGRLYTNALLASLNARRNLRSTVTNATSVIVTSHIFDSTNNGQIFGSQVITNIQYASNSDHVKRENGSRYLQTSAEVSENTV